MKIKEREYHKVMSEVNEILHDDIYGCDECKKILNKNNKDCELLDMTLFKQHHDEEPKRLDFCSWDCVIKYIPKLENEEYFATLPNLLFDRKGVTSAKHLISILNKLWYYK